MLAVIARILILVNHVFAVRKRGSFFILTTDDRNADLESCPNGGIAGGVT